MFKKTTFAVVMTILLLSVIFLLTNKSTQTASQQTNSQQTKTKPATAVSAAKVVNNTRLQSTPQLTKPHVTNTHTNTTTQTDAQLPHNAKQSFDPNADYTYSSPVLADAIKGLNTLNDKRKAQQHISEAEVSHVWQQIDAASQAGFLEPIAALLHKEWLVSLVPSSQLQQKFAQESATTRQQLITAHQAQQQADATDAKFLAYKAAEKRLTTEIMTKYPNDLDKASAELGKALDTVRSQIYNTP